MSKLNILELNKNLKAYAADVLGKVDLVNEEMRTRMQQIKRLESELLSRIETRDARQNAAAESAESALEPIEAAELSQAAPSSQEIPVESAPVPIHMEAEPVLEASPEAEPSLEGNREERLAPAAAKESHKKAEPAKEQANKVEVEKEKVNVADKEVKPIAPAPKKDTKANTTNSNINVYIPDLSAFKPRIRVVRSAKDEELEQKKREDRQKRAKSESSAAPRAAGERPKYERSERPGIGRPPRPQGPGRSFGGADKGFDKDADPQDAKRPAAKEKAERTAPRAPVIGKDRHPAYDSKKKATEEELSAKRRRTGIKEKVVLDDDEFAMGSRKNRKKDRARLQLSMEPVKIESAIITGDIVSIKVLAERIGKPAAGIVKKLMLLGILCTINSEIDFDTASLIAADFGVTLSQRFEQTAEATLIAEDKEDTEETLLNRPPVVTVMGHVDHGKTSLLDAIRKTKVQEGEAGGITQHIGAYTVEARGKAITFLDTPGHEAFTSMRARGAQATDIAVLVVAADDGVMPQTEEAISHAKSAGVPILVAINKIDKPGANVDRVKQELTKYGLVAEEWGGDTVIVAVSAVTGEGIDTLLEMILLLADVRELRANPDRLAKGTIIEASLDKGRGPVATVLVQNGTLHVQDMIVAGMAMGRVRAMFDDSGKPVKEAGPSIPVEVIGFSEVPNAGDIIYAVEQDKLSRQVVEERKDRLKAEKVKVSSKVSLDDLFTRIAEGQIKDLNIIVKADVRGSVEAVSQSLEKISNDEVRVRVVHGGVGAINESDVMLASAGNAIIIGFNVRPDVAATAIAEKEHVDIRLYRIIYNAIDDVEKAMRGMLAPEFVETVLGHAEVRQTFKVSAVGTIAGCYVQDGKLLRNAKARLLRDHVVVHEGSFSSLKRFKDDVREVAAGYECGASLENFNDLKEGDVIEAYEVTEVKK